MKKTLMTMVLLLALATGAEAAMQNHRHTPREQEELVDTTQGKDAVEAFSDTTSTAAQPKPWGTDAEDGETDADEDVADAMRYVFSNMDSDGIAGMLFVLAVLLIVFVLAPVLIIIALFYFINKNRKQKLQIAQMAMQQGQPIPQQLLEDKVNSVTDEYQKGLRQCFVGVGLMIFLGLTAKEVGFGIGALVFCIGLGKIVAAKMAEKKNNING